MGAFPFHLEILCCLGDVDPRLWCPLLLYCTEHVNTRLFPGQTWNYQGRKGTQNKGHSEAIPNSCLVGLPYFLLEKMDLANWKALHYQPASPRHSWMLGCQWLWLINPSPVWRSVPGLLPSYCSAEWVIWSGLIFLACEIEISHGLLHSLVLRLEMP